MILDEEITMRIVMAAVLIISGVVVANLRKREREKISVPEVVE